MGARECVCISAAATTTATTCCMMCRIQPRIRKKNTLRNHYRARDLFVRMFMLTAVEQTKKCHSVSGARTLVRDDARPSQRTAHADRILRRHVVIRNVQRKIKLCAVRSKEHQPNNTRKHGEKKTYPGLKSFVCVCDKEPENKCI